jgi:hypothetical protein
MLLSNARCFQSVCSSVTPWCIILFSTNNIPLVHPPVNYPPDPHQSPPPPPQGLSREMRAVVRYPSFQRTKQYYASTLHHWNQGSSVTIVSGFGLGDRAIEVWSPAEARDFSSNLYVQTGSGTPLSLLCSRYWGSFARGVKCGQGVTLTTHPHLVPRLWMSRSYTSSLSLHLHRCVVGLLYPFLLCTIDDSCWINLH